MLLEPIVKKVNFSLNVFNEPLSTKNYTLLSLNFNTINTIDLYTNKVIGIVQQSPSIVPAYNPGFKLISFYTKEIEGSTTVVMNEQTQYYLDIETANSEHDLRPHGSRERLEFNSAGCSSKYDYEIEDFTPASLTFWMRKIQNLGHRFKHNPIRQYFICLEIHTSTFNDQMKLNPTIVKSVLLISGLLFVAGSMLIIKYGYANRQQSANNYFESQPLLPNK